MIRRSHGVLDVEDPFSGVAAEHLAAQAELDRALLDTFPGAIIVRISLQPHRRSRKAMVELGRRRKQIGLEA